MGIGGGLIIVPVLASVFYNQQMEPTVVMHLAVGTSLATIVVTSISSIYAHHRRRAVLWPLFWRLAPGIVVGAWLGAWLAAYLPGQELRLIFGVFELLVALQMAFSLQPPPSHSLPNRAAMAFAAGSIGSLSAVVGIGGGTLTVPYLTWCKIPIHNAIATAAACGLPIAVAGSAGFIVSGWNQAALPAYASGFVYWPAFFSIIVASALCAPLGAKLAHALPAQKLRIVFALFLFLLALWMLFG